MIFNLLYMLHNLHFYAPICEPIIIFFYYRTIIYVIFL